MENSHFIKRITRTLTFKFILVGFISLLLLIPASWVKSLILEREQRSSEVFSEISSLWGFSQEITGPWLTIPYKIIHENSTGTETEIHNMHFLPWELSVDAQLVPQTRHRGIFRVVVYTSTVDIKGEFSLPDFQKEGIDPGNVLWDKATLTMGITDMRGIRNQVRLNVNGSFPEIIPGVENTDLCTSGLHCSIDPGLAKSDRIEFSSTLNLNGTKSFHVYPLGKTTTVNLSSSWPDPGFTGAFLPEESKIDQDGFRARWLITHLNRNYPQSWTDERYDITKSGFGVDLVNPVDHYQQSFRSVKYAMMFIGLTFLLFMLVEILTRKRLHPVQYVLTGFGLVIFYSLLVSLSEHTGFTIAYLISSVAVITLLSYYIKVSLGKLKYAVITALVLAALYLFLFIVLRLQDYALLMGSIGLFAVLSLFMILTRKINWYREEAEDQEEFIPSGNK